MSRTALRAWLETVILLWATAGLVLASVLSPPDPMTQMVYVPAALIGSALVSFVLVYSTGYRRIVLSVRAYLVVLLGLVASVFPVGLLAEWLGPPIETVMMVGGIAFGVAVGIWLAYHDGLSRIRSRAVA